MLAVSPSSEVKNIACRCRKSLDDTFTFRFVSFERFTDNCFFSPLPAMQLVPAYYFIFFPLIPYNVMKSIIKMFLALILTCEILSF